MPVLRTASLRTAPASAIGSAPVRLWRQLAAMAYDLLILIALLMTLTIAVILVRGGNAVGTGSLWFQGLLLGTWWLYFVWCWAHGGQTVGMRAWRLVLVADGPPARGPPDAIGLGRASLRFMSAGLSAAALGLGFAWSLFDPGRRSWHDRLSRTSLRYRPPLTQAQDRDRGNDDQDPARRPGGDDGIEGKDLAAVGRQFAHDVVTETDDEADQHPRAGAG